ncbi:hypothetical protein V7S43_002088 [Phytophthora oleae]|uniref:Zinc finger PHD-type domain-containing protein n=1 Tax=Phytophthora oleae TaxID=2107226 RepID=A0ABD3G0W5_9STRA
MSMKCTCSNCMNPEVPMTMPCTVCKWSVHHMCSNELCRYHGFDLETIAVRASCITIHTKMVSPTVEAPSGAVDAAETMLDLQMDVGQETETDCSREMGGDASQSSSQPESSDGRKVDVYGIPVEIAHYRQARACDEPYAITDDDDADVFTHVCLLSAEGPTAASNAPVDAWEGALKKYSTTSNVKDHLANRHEKHPLGKAEAAKKAQRANITRLFAKQMPRFALLKMALAGIHHRNCAERY